jgi:hypothetical protein
MRDKGKCVGETKLFLGNMDLANRDYASNGSA